MRFNLIIILFLFCGSLFPQGVADTTMNIPLISVNFAGQKPFGYLKYRFVHFVDSGALWFCLVFLALLDNQAGGAIFVHSAGPARVE